ncbi:MAG: YtxH domain-containing protein [Deltaproteobacteria bacterium]|nr:YtxH domain-containing protein [Deltaproteobacteria bacterium]
MNEDTAKIGGALLIGGLIGAGIALLAAPKSGRKTRLTIFRAARRARHHAAALIEETIDDVNGLIEDLKVRAADVAEQGGNLTDKAKLEIMSTLEQGQHALEKQKQKFSEALKH